MTTKAGTQLFVAAGRAHELLGDVIVEVDRQLGVAASSAGLWRMGRIEVRFVGRQWLVVHGEPVEALFVVARQAFGTREQLAAYLAEVDS